MVAFILEAIGSICITMNASNFICFVIASCRFMVAFATDVEAEVNHLDECNQTKENDVGLVKKLRGLIEFHSNVQR